MMDNLQCPADRVMINENKARIIAFFVLLSAIAFILTGYIPIVALLLSDFFLRVFNLGNYSPFGLLSDVVISWFKIKNKPTDRAPKRFAAGTGLVFVAFIFISAIFNWAIAANSITAVLVVFAGLESFFNFCAGCYVYSFIQNFSGKYSR